MPLKINEEKSVDGIICYDVPEELRGQTFYLYHSVKRGEPAKYHPQVFRDMFVYTTERMPIYTEKEYNSLPFSRRISFAEVQALPDFATSHAFMFDLDIERRHDLALRVMSVKKVEDVLHVSVIQTITDNLTLEEIRAGTDATLTIFDVTGKDFAKFRYTVRVENDFDYTVDGSEYGALCYVYKMTIREQLDA